MRFEGLSPEAASNVLAANIVNATDKAQRRLNPAVKSALETVFSVIGAAAIVAFFWFAWVATP